MLGYVLALSTLVVPAGTTMGPLAMCIIGEVPGNSTVLMLTTSVHEWSTDSSCVNFVTFEMIGLAGAYAEYSMHVHLIAVKYDDDVDDVLVVLALVA